MGQPKRGIRENVANITADQIRSFRDAHYIGSSMVLVGTGNVNHDALVQSANDGLSKINQSTPSGLEVARQEKAYFTPSLMFIRDDEMVNTNIGVFFDVPTWSDPDFYAMHQFKNILGDYRQDRDTGHHLNSSDRQYNQIHTVLGKYPDITLQKTSYLPYSDSALFGSYFHGNEVHAFTMLYLSQAILSEYAYILDTSEVFRARNKSWMDLLQEDCGCCLNNRIGKQLLYLNRRVPRSEEATRISALTPGHLTRAANRWFFDRVLPLH
jgi:predicted Zn-dependent peptidase